MQRTTGTPAPIHSAEACAADACCHGDDQRPLLLQRGRQRPHHLRHDLRLDREHDDVGACNGSDVVAGDGDAEVALQAVTGRCVRFGNADASRIGALGNQAANQAARHVATANEGDAQ